MKFYSFLLKKFSIVFYPAILLPNIYDVIVRFQGFFAVTVEEAIKHFYFLENLHLKSEINPAEFVRTFLRGEKLCVLLGNSITITRIFFF